MKFTNGYWLDKDGYDLIYPRMVYDTEKNDNSVEVYAPCATVEHRGQTLNLAMLTLNVSSPLQGVLRIRIFHHKGGLAKGPAFEIDDAGLSLDSSETEELLDIRSGGLTARIDKKQWEMHFLHDDMPLTSSLSKAAAYIKDPTGHTFIKEELSLDVGENIYGLGERFTAFIKNGQSVDVWNEDGGTSSEQSYKNIPFYISSKGYGVFVNHPEKVSFEIASEKVSRVQFCVSGESLEYFLISGMDLKDVLQKYTTLTGKPARPPAWSFGLWLSTSFLTDYDESTVNRFINDMRKNKIPLSVFHFDCFWMKAFEWCNFLWNSAYFPNPEAFISSLKAKGLKVCVWINPYIAQKSPLFDIARQQGYLLKKENGDAWQWDLWQAGMGIVDFTNPEACAWYQRHLETLIDMGVDAFKTDFGERIPVDALFFDGSDSQKMHNYYPYIYNRLVFDVLRNKRGPDEAILFARSATVGSQKYPVHWGGDCISSYPSMAESLRGGLSLTLSGFGFWSHDIAGFENSATADLYKRWTQFGLLSTHSRYHGSGEYKVPWLYGEEAVAVTRKFTRLKCSLMPYLYRVACETAETGIPMLRAMLLEFDQDETCSFLDRQYMLGDALLVAPVFNADGIAKYYLPEGKWTNILTGDVITGGGWQREKHGYMTLPVLAREHSVIPFGKDSETVYDYRCDIAFHMFEPRKDAAINTVIYDTKGQACAALKTVLYGNRLTIEADGLSGKCCIVLRNRDSVMNSHGLKTESTHDGMKVFIQNGTSCIDV